MMAAIAKYRDDNSGSIAPGGTGSISGTSSAYTLTSNQGFTSFADMALQQLTFASPATNAAGVTLNVDGLGALPIHGVDGTPVPAGTMVGASVYTVVCYTNRFVLHSLFGNPFNIPIGGMMDFIGSSVPNANFVFPIGQAISRTTYATLFSLIGTTYGTGDGSTTFNVPDLTGRVVAMKEATATRLTTAGGGIDGGTLGATGGAQNITLAANQIPTITASNASQAISVTTTQQLVYGPNIGSAVGGGSQVTSSDAGSGAIHGTLTSTGNNSISATYTNSSQVAAKTVMPAIILQKILRII